MSFALNVTENITSYLTDEFTMVFVISYNF